MMKKLILMALIAIPMSVFAQKFGYVNTAVVMQAMPEYTKAQNDLQELQSQYEGEMKLMQDELQKKAEEYEKAKDTLPAPVKERREKELGELYQRLQQYAQESNQSLQQASNEKMQEIEDKLLKAIQEVGKTGNYVYILDLLSGTPYISETLATDVTDQVKAKLGIK